MDWTTENIGAARMSQPLYVIEFVWPVENYQRGSITFRQKSSIRLKHTLTASFVKMSKGRITLIGEVDWARPSSCLARAPLDVGHVFMKCGLFALMLSAFAVPAFADDAASDKSDYTLFNPTPDADLRSFNTDRPPKANSP